jgi:hypothetical protein
MLNMNATVSTAGTEPLGSLPLETVLFYQYAVPLWSKETRDRLLDAVMEYGKNRNLGGRIRVACEGWVDRHTSREGAVLSVHQGIANMIIPPW